MNQADFPISGPMTGERPAPTLALRMRLPAVFCAVALALAALLVHPVLERGINDDFAYVRVALELARMGRSCAWLAASSGGCGDQDLRIFVHDDSLDTFSRASAHGVPDAEVLCSRRHSGVECSDRDADDRFVSALRLSFR
jgi:hypothetical protein